MRSEEAFMYEDKIEELCLICEKSFDDWDITIPKKSQEGGGKSHLECVERLIPKRYPNKIK